MLRSFRLRTEMPELDFPPQTPNSSTVLGGGQQSPPASCPPGQQLPVKSMTWPVPLQAPHASSWPLQHVPKLSSVALAPVQHAPASLTTPACHQYVSSTVLPLQLHHLADRSMVKGYGYHYISSIVSGQS